MDHDAYDAFDAFKRRIRRIQTTHLNDAFEAWNIYISLYSDGIYYTWCNTIYLKKRAKNMDHDAYDAFDAFKRRIRRIQTTH